MSETAFFSLLLASQSPRRKQLLESMGFPFRTVYPLAEEVFPEPGQAARVALDNAVAKARSLVPEAAESEIILGADTLVVLDDLAIGKPKDRDAARESLRTLSGKTHTVVSGVYLWSKKWGEKRGLAESRVTFRPLGDDEIESYTALKEPYDKAGSYAVQGASALFIDKIEGSFSNVMGLPMEMVIRLLAELTRRSPFDLFEKNEKR